MSDNSRIEWTNATWSPVVGCSRVSPGCDHCYAIREAHRMAGNPNGKIANVYSGLTRERQGRIDWTATIKVLSDRLEQPLRWQKPRRIFVNPMSDLFHPSVPFEFIKRIVAIMTMTPRHTYQILTKRPERMLEFYTHPQPWPTLALPNVWLGVSVENQATANERIPLLLRTPAAVRWLSCEPLLGPINLGRACPCGYYCDPDGLDGYGHHDHPFWTPGLNTGIHWVVCGGESGPGARPMHPAWARSLRDQCQSARVPYFFKQHGEYIARSQLTVAELRDLPDRVYANAVPIDGDQVYRVGKKVAGRLLDGREWSEYPEVVDALH